MHQDRYSKDACGMSSSSDGTCPVQANRRFACLRLRLRLPKGRGGGGGGEGYLYDTISDTNYYPKLTRKGGHHED
jgi:hypothetical protein